MKKWKNKVLKHFLNNNMNLTKDSDNTKAIEALTFLNNKIQKAEIEFKKTGKKVDLGFRNIVLLGPVGVGKTYIAKTLIKHDYFKDESEFKQELISGALKIRSQSQWDIPLSYYPLLMLAKRKLVIYDDYGVSDLTEAYIEKMLYWLNGRRQRELITVFTSNLTLEQIHAREKRIASRILENAVVIEMKGEDRRTQDNQVIYS